MMKNKYFMVAFMIAIIIAMQNVDANVGMQSYTRVNSVAKVTRDYGYFGYGTTQIFAYYSLFAYRVFNYVGDFVPNGRPFQAYILYGLDPIAEWNVVHPDNQIDLCTILVREQHQKITGALFWQNTTFDVNYTLNRTFTVSDTAVAKDMSKHFVSLQKGDFAEIFFDCHFTGNLTILTPASFSIVFPTRNCLQCQFYNSEISEFDNLVSDIIQNYTNQIFNAIITFIIQQMELLGTGFWIALTLLSISVVAFAFLILYWVYLFLRSKIREFQG